MTGWGTPHPPPTPPWLDGVPSPHQHSEHLLRGGRNASCVHAGGLSCYYFIHRGNNTDDTRGLSYWQCKQTWCAFSDRLEIDSPFMTTALSRKVPCLLPMGRRITAVFDNLDLSLPTTYEVQWKTMFSLVCVSVHRREGGDASSPCQVGDLPCPPHPLPLGRFVGDRPYSSGR